MTDCDAMRVMTFNIRTGNAPDGINRWDQRRTLCAERIAAFAPDLLGLQEAMDFQNAFLIDRLPGYAALGVARDDGGMVGEFSTLLYRPARFTPLASGTFWLSATPDVPGSRGWDAACPRIATWARLRDRLTRRDLVVLNTHLDHEGARARLEAARHLRSFLAAQREPAIVLGDFNATPDEEPYRALVDGREGTPLVDAYAALHGARTAAQDGTFHDFGRQPVPTRIDWILCDDGFAPTMAAIDRHRAGAVFPSDHYPVGAVLAWR